MRAEVFPGMTGRRFHIALFAFLVIFLISSSCPKAYAAKNRDLIVVIDVSTSMRDIFDDTKKEAKQLISSAQWGDRVTLITFGRSSRLLERARVKSSYDTARILSTIDNLEATEFDTNLSSAMERGLEEMRQYYQEAPDAERVMMWLSDDKSNPPKDVPNLITFEVLKQRENGQLPDNGWFEFKAPIKSEVESDVKWFIDWASRRQKMQLKVAAPISDAGTVFTSNPEAELYVQFDPESKAVWGTSFSVVAELIDQNDKSRSVKIPVNPAVVICSGTVWTQKILVKLPDKPGNYDVRLSFLLPSDKLLEITPPQALFKARVERETEIADAQGASADDVISAAYREGAHKNSGRESSFERKMRTQLIRDLEQQRREQPSARENVEFGPIYGGSEYQRSIPLSMSRGIPLDTIHMRTNFQLPGSLKLTPSFRISEGKLFVDLSLNAKEFVTTTDGWEVRGSLSFFSSEEDVNITPTDIPARFYSKSVQWRWGKQELVVAAEGKQGDDIVPGVVAFVKSIAPRAGKALAVILVLCLVYYLTIRYWFASTHLVGTLEIVKNPMGRKRRYFNLYRLGKRKKANSLTIGSSSKADIALPHASVADIHATITTASTDAGIIVFVRPCNGSRVLVNNVPYSRQKEIGDKDTLTIGDCVFVYTRPELYRKTVVCFADGRTIRGSLVSWDIDAPSFEFLPHGAPSVDAKMVISFSELKTVSFIRKNTRFSLDRFLNAGNGKGSRNVEIIFKDGDLIEGRIVGESGEWDKRFYLSPKDNEEVGLVLVERAAVQNIFTQETIEEPFIHIRRALRMLTGRP